MENLPTDAYALFAAVFALGMHHGMDADHLATVDGLTRCNGRFESGVGRWAGLLFSVGHGAVVVAVAVALSVATSAWVVPDWVEGLGAAISVLVLVLLGVLNLYAVYRARPWEVVVVVGVRGRWFQRLREVRSPAVILLVGGLFAFSFDTLSQAVLFSLAAGAHGGGPFALLLGLSFMGGMLVVDGANGLWVSRLLARADRLACVASRVMGLTVGGLSLAVAGYGAARHVSPAVAQWSEGREAFFGLAVLALVAASFVSALVMTRGEAAEA